MQYEPNAASMSVYKLLEWLDTYIQGMLDNGQSVPYQLLEVRNKLSDLAFYDSK